MFNYIFYELYNSQPIQRIRLIQLLNKYSNALKQTAGTEIIQLIINKSTDKVIVDFILKNIIKQQNIINQEKKSKQICDYMEKYIMFNI